jgi:diamine N-acetyltransferase
MKLILKEVTADNWQQVVALRMPQVHRDLVPSNAYSLAESKFVADRIPLAVYDDELLIGLVVVSYNESIGRGWIHRFMIDQQFVNKGYSRKTIKMVIRRMRRLPGCQFIGVDYRPKNTILEQFYEGLHFQKTAHATEAGDAIAILRVRPERPEAAQSPQAQAKHDAQSAHREQDTLALTAQDDDVADEIDLSMEEEELSEEHSVPVARG